MYAVVRSGTLKPGMTAEFVAKAEQAAEGLTGKIPGFKAFYIIAGEGDTMCTVGVFDNKGMADAAQSIIAAAIQGVFAPMLASPPTAIAGTVAVAKTF